MTYVQNPLSTLSIPSLDLLLNIHSITQVKTEAHGICPPCTVWGALLTCVMCPNHTLPTTYNHMLYLMYIVTLCTCVVRIMQAHYEKMTAIFKLSVQVYSYITYLFVVFLAIKTSLPL